MSDDGRWARLVTVVAGGAALNAAKGVQTNQTADDGMLARQSQGDIGRSQRRKLHRPKCVVGLQDH